MKCLYFHSLSLLKNAYPNKTYYTTRIGFNSNNSLFCFSVTPLRIIAFIGQGIVWNIQVHHILKVKSITYFFPIHNEFQFLFIMFNNNSISKIKFLVMIWT